LPSTRNGAPGCCPSWRRSDRRSPRAERHADATLGLRDRGVAGAGREDAAAAREVLGEPRLDALPRGVDGLLAVDVGRAAASGRRVPAHEEAATGR
jgi:hypothetical protein